MGAECPVCNNPAKYIGKADESHTANGHHAKVYECKTPDCPSNGPFLGGF